MEISFIDSLNGILSILAVTTFAIIGLNIIARYFQYRQKEFLYMGISWIGIMCPWYPSAISFLMVRAGGIGLPLVLYIFIGTILIPILLLIWLLALTNLIFVKRKKSILLSEIIIGIFFELVLLFLLFTRPSLLGELKTPVDIQYKSILSLYILHVVLVLWLTGTLLGKNSLKSKDPELKLKGRLIIAGISLWSLCGVLDSAISLEVISLTLIRILLILGGILFYGGFMMPKWTKKIFLNQKLAELESLRSESR